MHFVKLFSNLTDSSVWVHDDKVFRLWILLLTKADQSGFVCATIPGLARSCNYSLEDTEKAMLVLESPDPHSKTKDEDGRRIIRHDEGWSIVTYEKYKTLQVEKGMSMKPSAVSMRKKRNADS